MAYSQYPSERRASGAKARVRRQSFTVWRCKGCKAEVDVDPYASGVMRTWAGCKFCGSKLGYAPTRIRE